MCVYADITVTHLSVINSIFARPNFFHEFQKRILSKLENIYVTWLPFYLPASILPAIQISNSFI